MIKSLQGLRVVAMLTIFLYHTSVIPNAGFPVTFFFILSGFVIYLNYNNRYVNVDIKASVNFMMKRIKKIYLLHIIMLIFSIFIKYEEISVYSLAEFIPRLLANVLLIQSFIPKRSYYFCFNNLAWFLSSLMLCYFTSLYFIKIIKHISKTNLKLIIIFLIISEFIIMILGNDYSYETRKYIFYINPLLRLIEFFIGMCIAKIFSQRNIILQNKKNIIKYTIIELIILITIILQYIFSFKVPQTLRWGVFYSPIIIFGIYVFSLEYGNISKILGGRIWIKLSEISLEFYLVHELVIISVKKIIPNNGILMVLVSIITSFLLATFMKKYVSGKSFFNILKATNI